MIKVMYVLNTGKYSGAENVVISLICAIKNSVEATYVSLDGPIKEYLDENDIRFEPVKCLSVSEVRRIVKIIKPDIIHANDFTAGIICAIATNIPIINHIHNNSPWIKRFNIRSVVYAMSCFKYKKILTVSESVMDEYIFGKFFKRKSVVIANPIDVKKIRELAGVADIRYDVAFLGRLSLAKNPDMFIEIIHEAIKRKPDIKAIMIGDGELREEIKSKIKLLGLNENIHMVGFKKNPYQFLNQAKILLMPSKWEGYGLAAAEALSIGKPVICSDVGGLPKIIDKSCGRVCCNFEEYCKAVNVLLSDPEQYEACVIGAYSRIEEVYDAECYSNSIMQLYRDTL